MIRLSSLNHFVHLPFFCLRYSSIFNVSLLLIVVSALNAQDLIVNDFGGEGSSFHVNSSFTNGQVKVTIADRNGGLDIVDLNKFSDLDSIIIENLNGDIRFANGLFHLGSSTTQLVLRSSGDVYISVRPDYYISANITIQSQGTVHINGSGFRIKQGMVKIESDDLRIVNDGLTVEDGVVEGCVLNSTIISGRALSGSNYSFYLESDNIDIAGSGIRSSNWIDLSNSKNLTLDGNGISTHNLHLSSDHLVIQGAGIQIDSGQCHLQGSLMNIRSGGFLCNNSYTSIHFAQQLIVENNGVRINDSKTNIKGGNSILIKDKGIQLNNSRLISEEVDLVNLSGDGIRSNNGDIVFRKVSEIQIYGGGINSDSGHISIDADKILIGHNRGGGSGLGSKSGNINLSFGHSIEVTANGVYSNTGTIAIAGDGDILIQSGGVYTSGSNISVQSLYGKIILGGYNLNTAHQSDLKGGKLDTLGINSSRLQLITEPVLGGGDITIRTN